MKPVGIADLTASTASDAIPHSLLFGLRSSSYAPTRAEQHLPCSYSNLDNQFRFDKGGCKSWYSRTGDSRDVLPRTTREIPMVFFLTRY